jgi:small ligand-binding sensory domain FIST
VEEALAKVQRPTAALVFVSGNVAADLERVAASAAKYARGTPLVIVGGAGVLTERGEIEDEGAAALLAWSGGRAEILTVRATSAEDASEGLARVIGDHVGRAAPPGLVFVRPDGFAPQSLEPLQSLRGAHHLFGAGTLAGMDTYSVRSDASVESGAATVLLIHDMAPPLLRTSPACRLLTPLRRITEARGSMVVSIENEPALDVLSLAGQDLADQPLIFAVLAPDIGDANSSARPELLVRAVQGVDPLRRSLVVSEEIAVGMRLAFAVRDAGAARADLESALRDLKREMAGAMPRFGIYINCAGRGSSLYGAYDVDTRLVRAHFGDMPFAGLQSSFEIAPHVGKPTLKLYTGVLALFTALS